jgi:hypothetical protein
MNLKFLAPICLSLTLVGCFSPSTYHPFNGTDGYQQIQMNNRLWEVRYTGNQATSQSQVHNMMLYRSGEIAQNHGYHYFKVLSQVTKDNRSVFVQPGYESEYTVKKHHHKRTVTQYNPPTKEVINRYTTVMRIRLLKHGGNGNRIYKASALLSSLGPEISWPKPKS